MSITAENGQVVWRMTPNRARKIAALLRAYTRAFSEATRLDTAATEACPRLLGRSHHGGQR